MQDKASHTFIQFINERGDWDFSNYYSKYLKGFKFEEPVNAALIEFENALNSLENEFWYNREGSYNGGHYALNMKMNQYPDLDKWANAKGEEDLEDITEDLMYQDWANFMEEIYEVETEDMLGEFSWVKRFGAGGKSGGWLLVYPEADHNDLERTVNDLMDNYLSETGLLSGEEIDKIKQAELSDANPADAALADLGLAEITDYSDLAEMADELHTSLVIENRELDNRYTDLNKMVVRIKEFKDEAEKMFYEWVSDRSFNESKLPTFKQFVINESLRKSC